MTDPDVPSLAEIHGFRIKPTGTHLSRTMMLEDLRVVLSACADCSDRPQYQAAVVDDNILAKPTAKSAQMSFERLRELYAFDPALRIFRALVDIWPSERSAQPLVALLCATARDPILRAITPFLLDYPAGAKVTPLAIAQEAEQQFPGKFERTSLQRLGRNAASSWTQAGLLEGRQKKARAKAEAHPVAVAYALLLGDLCGRRGQALFTTLWARILDASPHELRRHAEKASREGWIDYRAAGDVVEITFSHLMREEA
ncbi:MAG: hypothetical protein OXI18_04930 [bacterium]|nr:hypothetical protein [bacterium]